jgi:hypothetical protein
MHNLIPTGQHTESRTVSPPVNGYDASIGLSAVSVRAVGWLPPPEHMALGLQARRAETPPQCKSACRAGATAEHADSAVAAASKRAGATATAGPRPLAATRAGAGAAVAEAAVRVLGREFHLPRVPSTTGKRPWGRGRCRPPQA